MSYVKALFGDVIGEDVSVAEGKIGFTEKDYQFKELETRGICKLFPTLEEAENFKFKTSQQLFAESYKNLNPAEGDEAGVSLIDFAKGQPAIIDGVPANYIIEKETKEEPTKKEEPIKTKVETNVKSDQAPTTTTTPGDSDKK